MKRSYCLLALLCSIFIGSLITVGVSSALEYQTNPSTGDNPVTLKFEFGSTLNITTGGNISISDLTPGTKAISASNYNVTVSTNNLTGYTLSATVGCSSGTDCYDSKNLSDGTNTFSMLSADGALTAGTWGVSLDSSATANSNFKTIAKYDETATILNKTKSNSGAAFPGYSGSANTTVRVGAYATTSQVAGAYTNAMNFIAIANPMPEFMQEVTTARLAELMPNVGDVAILYDNRDTTAYTIGKLADGNYWMLDNLALDLTDPNVLNGMSNANTNASNLVLNYLKNGGGNSSNAVAITGVANWTTSTYNGSYSYSDPLVNMSSKDIVATGSIAGSKGQHKIGGFYNFCAASAGSYCYGNGTSYGMPYGDSTDDICPAGWRIPTGGASGEAQTLVTAITGTTGEISGDNANTVIRDLSMAMYGVVTTGAAVHQGDYGLFWLSTKNDSIQMGVLGISPGTVYPQSGDHRIAGISVRCLFSL